ncbi:HU family DNA-binding protein [Altericista sp. CCNU0014]|uniref:HU family DNA-binding protein n=1 Tax=Altericista sp. CCNU0014 TaxID=3082949 RepID=UPI00384DB64A
MKNSLDPNFLYPQQMKLRHQPSTNSKTMKNEDLVQNISARTGLDRKTVDLVFDTVLDEIYNSLKRCESVTLKNFGTFYIRKGHGQQVFKFNPSQKLRKLFGWASTYKGNI